MIAEVIKKADEENREKASIKRRRRKILIDYLCDHMSSFLDNVHKCFFSLSSIFRLVVVRMLDVLA